MKSRSRDGLAAKGLLSLTISKKEKIKHDTDD